MTRLIKISGLIIVLLSISFAVKAQIQNVIVETYYISDANDATDTTGGNLPAGSHTYRVYVDLVKGSRITKIYGDQDHALKFSSTASFFNHKTEGQTYGKDFTKSRLTENTVALDSWITLGQVTKVSGKLQGILKNYDTNGSVVGGVNNDGGSALIPGGLLVNNDQAAGVPLTTSDGNDTLTNVAGTWYDYGFLNSIGEDSTIFGSISNPIAFISNNCGLQYSSGIRGISADSNQVLVAQLTTQGQLAFELNLEVVDSLGNVTKYVASDSILNPGEIFSRKLKYPFQALCGCPDPRYLEYLDDRDCDSQDSCKNLIVFGCMDTLACNYDPNANVNIVSMCCYPGKCNDRDISKVCPDLNNQKDLDQISVVLSPNPVQDRMEIQPVNTIGSFVIQVTDMQGRLIRELAVENYNRSIQLDVSLFDRGIYLLRVINNSNTSGKTFIKL